MSIYIFKAYKDRNVIVKGDDPISECTLAILIESSIQNTYLHFLIDIIRSA